MLRVARMFQPPGPQFYAKKMDNTDLNCHSDLVLEFMKIREAAMDFIQARTKFIFLECPFTGFFLFSFK